MDRFRRCNTSCVAASRHFGRTGFSRRSSSSDARGTNRTRRMRIKTVAIGFGFLGVAAVTAVAVKRPPPDQPPNAPRRPDLALGGADTLEVHTALASTTLVRSDGTYKVTAPVRGPADAKSAHNAFQTLERLYLEKMVSADPAAHQEHGVGRDALRVVMKKAGAVVLDLRVGKMVAYRTFVRLEGQNEIWRASGDLRDVLDHATFHWRDKRILTFDRHKAVKLEVQTRSAGQIVLARSRSPEGKADSWSVASATVKVESMDVQAPRRLMALLAAFSTNEFADGVDPVDAGLVTPEARLIVTLDDGRQESLTIGRKKDADLHYVKSSQSEQVFLVHTLNLERVYKRPIEFRAKRVCTLEDLIQIDVTRRSDGFVLVKGAEGNGWRATKPVGLQPHPSKVEALVTAFRALDATTLAEPNTRSSARFEQPVAVVRARGRGRGAECVLTVGALTPDTQHYHVQRAGARDVYLVPKWALHPVLVPSAELAQGS